MTVTYFEFRLKSNILAKWRTNKIRSRYPRLKPEYFQQKEKGVSIQLRRREASIY